MDIAIPPPSADPWSIHGKFAPPEEHAQVLVVGGGGAGLACATEAARLGLRVVLVDENPVPISLMGIDVPLFYGQRMNAAVQEEARMVERLVASDPAIEAAFDAGVDVRLGVTAWGAFANGPALHALPARVVGLSDGRRSWLCGFDALVLATGARDLVLGFDGVELPGVMGACAFDSLLRRYDAFDGKRLVILGSGEPALDSALSALDRGLEVTALLEVLPDAQAAPDRIATLHARGVPVLTDVNVVRAEPGAAGVGAVLFAQAGAADVKRIRCDTVVLAIGAVPNVELAAVLGCRMAHLGELGGHVPVTCGRGETSLAGVFCVGECAGLAASDEAQWRDVAHAIAARLGTPTGFAPGVEFATRGPDVMSYRLAWMRVLLSCGDAAVPVCLCEEVSRAELLGVRPPRYLGHASKQQAVRDSATLRADGPLHPDQLKRLTRAGMGVCQGRRCREQVALTLALASGAPPAEIPLASYRAPVRPVPLATLADGAETSAMRAGWDVWFGIRTQWVPYEAIGTPAEDAFLAAGTGGNMHA